jgi:ATP/maltotriose-dependent transcriptional regulator MalT
MLSPQHWREAVALAEEFMGHPRDGVTGRTQGQILEFCGVALLENGDRDAAERAFRELSGVAERTRDASNQLQALSFEGALAVVDGRLADAVVIGQQLIERAPALGMPTFADLATRGRSRALIYTGELSPEDALVQRASVVRPLLLAHAGQLAEASEVLGSLLPAYQTDSGKIDTLSHSMNLAVLLEAATVLGDKQSAGLIAPLLAELTGASTGSTPACYQRLVGAAYALGGQWDEARSHYRRAIEACTKIRFRPELALSQLELAELLLEHYPDEHEEAVALLNEAVPELRAMKMQPALERALRHKGMLTA